MKQPPSSQREESSTEEADTTRPRLVGALLVLAGVVHLVVPSTLLELVEWGYETVFRVEFDPLPGASARVRAVGLGLIAAGAHLLYYGGIRPSKK